MKKFLLIRFSSFGDIVLTFPFIQKLIKEGHEIHLLTKQQYKPLYQLLGPSIHLHVIPNHGKITGLNLLCEKLRNEHFDYVYDLHRNLRSFFVCWRLKLPYRRIRKYRFREWALFTFRSNIFRKFFPRIPHRSSEPFFLKDENYVLESKQLSQANSKEPIVCINAESKWPSKQWGASEFKAVAFKLSSAGYKIKWIGQDQNFDFSPAANQENLIGTLSILEISLLLRKSSLLLSNDSGLMHLSEEVGTPVVAVFGPTTKDLGFAPRLKESRIAEKSLWCRPCSKTGRLCFRPVQRQKCLKLVTSDEVYELCLKTLNIGLKYEGLR